MGEAKEAMVSNMWSIERLEQVNNLAEKINDVVNETEERRLTFALWRNNPITLLHDAEDIYILADLILQMGNETKADAVHRCARDILVSLIALTIDYYDLFEKPGRAFFPYRDSNETHILYPVKLGRSLTLAQYDAAFKHIGNKSRCMPMLCPLSEDGLLFNQPQWMSVNQWKRSQRFPHDVRKAAWGCARKALLTACSDGGDRLTESMRQLQEDEERWTFDPG